MADWEAFCDARAVTRPRPLAAGFFAAEEVDVLFFVELLLFDAVLFFAAGADFVLLAVALLEAVPRGPLARVLAALLRLLAVVLLDAMVFAAWVLLEAVGFFAEEEVDVLFFVVLFFAAGADFELLAVLRVLLAPLAKVLAALLRAEALLLFLARVFALALLEALLLLLAALLALVDLLAGICVSLL